MTDQALLRLQDIEAGYQRPLVGPLSFAVNPGEVVVLQGANGAGKSTLLRALTGQARVFAGRHQCAPGVSIGYQCQHSPLPAELPVTGAEFLQAAGANTARLPARLRDLLPWRLDRLSGGQWQLLRVWAVLAQPAQLLLLDEPTNNLDPEGEALLSDALASLEPGRGVLLVCHEAAFVAGVAARKVEVA